MDEPALVSINNNIDNIKINPGQRVPIPIQRLIKAKASYNVRNIPLETATFLLNGDLQPSAGDLVLAEITSIGQHQRIELTGGRRAGLHIGDEIVVCYGPRYAPDQFEAYVPNSLEACHLVAAGGIAAKSISRHRRIKSATQILPLGLLADEYGKRINIKDWAITKPIHSNEPRPYTVAVIGSSMNAGKTTTAAGVIHTLKNKDLKIAAAKVTGTGAGGDRWKMVDAGADLVLDFTDTGLASTFRISQQLLESTFGCLMNNLSVTRPDVIVVEVADGLYQNETADLLASDVFKSSVDTLVFASGDALAAKAGADMLRQQGFSVCAVSGAINASPLAKREAATALDMPLLTPAEVGNLVYELYQVKQQPVQSQDKSDVAVMI
jgi:hypothetical protein